MALVGNTQIGFLGNDLHMNDRKLPVAVDHENNIILLHYNLGKNFSELDFDKFRYSVTFSAIQVIQGLTNAFNIEVSTRAPNQIWATTDSKTEVLSTFDSLVIPSDDKDHQITFVFNFTDGTLLIAVDNGSTTIVPIPRDFLDADFSTIDFGLSKIPVDRTFESAWEDGSGDYNGIFDKVYVGNAAGAACIQMNSLGNDSAICDRFLENMCALNPESCPKSKKRVKFRSDNSIEEVMNTDRSKEFWDNARRNEETRKAVAAKNDSVWIILVVFLVIAAIIFIMVSRRR